MGILRGIFDWTTHASYDSTTTVDWAAGLVVILILAFLWSTVVNHTIKEVV